MLSVPLILICGLPLACPKYVLSPALWALAALFVAFVNGTQWFEIDNHKYLIMYWTISCAVLILGIGKYDAVSYWRSNARLMIGLCFSCAVLWKLITHDFMSGAFLEHTLITDGRVESVASVVGGVPIGDLGMNRAAVGVASMFPSAADELTLYTSDRFGLMGVIGAWWTVVIESLVAVSWLCGASRLYCVRHVSLCAFILSTYVFLPVVGFASILCVCAMASAGPESQRMRQGYLVLLAAMQLTKIPWSSYVNGLPV